MQKKVFKLFLRIGIVIAILMMVISALLLVFKDDIKNYAIDEINKHLNKRAHIGYIDVNLWSTFPNLSLEFDDVLIHSKFGDIQTKDTALYAKKIRLRFSPVDFVKSNYTVKQIDIESAVFNMQTLENGKINYDFIKESDRDEESTFEFNLEHINISDLRYRFLNKVTAQDYQTHIENMTLSGKFTDEAYTMNASTVFFINHIKNKSVPLISKQQSSCTIALLVDNNQQLFEILNADLIVSDLPFHLDGKVTGDSMVFHVHADHLELKDVAKKLMFPELALLDELHGEGDVTFDLSILGETKSNALPAINADFKIANGKLSDSQFSADKINISGTYSNEQKGKAELLSLSNLAFSSAGSSFQGQMNITQFDKPRFKGSAKGQVDLKMIHRLFGPFNLNELEGSIGLNGGFDLQMNDPQFDPKNISIYTLKSNLILNDIVGKWMNDERGFELPAGELIVRNQRAVFKYVHFQLGDSDISIDGTFNNIADYFIKSGDLRVDAHIESNFLNLEDLNSNNGDSKKAKNWLLPNDIQGKVNLELHEVVYGGHTYKDVQARMNFAPRALLFPMLKGVNGGAHVKGDLAIQETNPMKLHITTKMHSSDIHFDRLFNEWNGFGQEVITSKNIKGLAKIDLFFEGPFDLYEGKDLSHEFTANAHIHIANGQLKNVQTFKEITESIKTTSTKLLIGKDNLDNFEKALLNLAFDNFENQLQIKNGVIYIPRMEIKSNALDIKLKGEHSFDNIIDYSFDFRYRELKSKNTHSEFGDIVDDGTGFRVYLRMKGDLFDPDFSWDKAQQKEDKKEKREAAKEELKSVLKTGLGIHKNDSTIHDYQTPEQKEEKIIVDFHKDSIQNEFSKEERKKRESKIQLKIEQWKKENEEEQPKEEFIID